MTTLEREREEQRRWRLRPPFERARVYDAFIEHEFLPPEEHRRREREFLTRIVRVAEEHSPYYSGVFARAGLSAEKLDGRGDLAKLPILSKHDLLANGAELRGKGLSPADQPFTESKSSGTTGQRVAVLHSRFSYDMSGLLKQRHSRWFRLDPMARRVEVRTRSDVATLVDGRSHPDGRIMKSQGWRDLKTYFHTGEEFAFNVSNRMETQLEMLRQLRPVYAASYPGTFEEWLFANEGENPCDSIEALIGLGAQLTEAMEKRIRIGFGAPVHMGYGLNEIGKVALRCEAGRYHVHVETCLVEIVRDDGTPCAHGETGHLLVTPLRNHAMPLFRYDTGDLAEAVEGPCACGRTLPAFGEIAGRFRNYAGLPSGSRERMRAIRDAIEGTRPEGLAFLRRYQVHQDRENRFTLRLRTVRPVPEEFRDVLRAAWAPVAGDPPLRLSIVEVDEIAASPSGKLLDFVSDFHTDSATNARPWVREAE